MPVEDRFAGVVDIKVSLFLYQFIIIPIRFKEICGYDIVEVSFFNKPVFLFLNVRKVIFKVFA